MSSRSLGSDRLGPQPRVPLIGVPAVPDDQLLTFRQGLRDLGHVEGQTIRFEFKSAKGSGPMTGPGGIDDDVAFECSYHHFPPHVFKGWAEPVVPLRRPEIRRQ